MTNYLVPKSSKTFHCDICDYNTSRNSQYLRHLSTEKHKRLIMANEKELKSSEKNNKIENEIFNCICGKQYKHQSSLCKHKQKCEILALQKNELKKKEKENSYLKDELIKTLIQENKEIKQILIDISNKPSNSIQHITNNNTTNTTNTTNNNFNLNFFLNVTCKDALNIDEFLNGIQLKLKDLETTGKLGYVNGISAIFINALKDLEVTKRPIHCSDIKRETLYIKDKDIWEKENENMERIRDAIKTITHENIKLIPIWQKENPQFLNSSSILNDTFIKIVKGTMNASTDEESDKNINKIIKNISKETVINKNFENKHV